MTIRWYGLVAPEEAPTGDRRMFAVDALSYRNLPLPMAWQRVSNSGHQGSVIVGSWTRQYKGDGGVWGSGEFLDPSIVPEVTEAAYLLEKRLIGPSVDLDPDMAYEIVDHPTQPGEFAMKVTRGNVHGVTLVMSPAFPQVHLTVDTMAEMDSLIASGILTAQFANSGVNSSSWSKFPLAPRETKFSADTAIENIAAWSEGNTAKFSSAFLWQNPDGNPLNRETYRLPIVDIINGKAYLIPRAVFSAGVIMSGGHGGLYDTLDAEQRVQVQEVITDIYDMLRDEYADPRIVAPWQRGGRQGATSEVDEPTRVASLENDMISDELDEYLESRIASALAEFAVRSSGWSSLPTSEGTWDEGAARRALAQWAGLDTGHPDWDKYGRAFLWRSDGSSQTASMTLCQTCAIHQNSAKTAMPTSRPFRDEGRDALSAPQSGGLPDISGQRGQLNPRSFANGKHASSGPSSTGSPTSRSSNFTSEPNVDARSVPSNSPSMERSVGSIDSASTMITGQVDSVECFACGATLPWGSSIEIRNAFSSPTNTFAITREDFKFPIAMPVDGKLTIFIRAVNNAKARLSQASIPAADKTRIEAILNSIQKRYGGGDESASLADESDGEFQSRLNGELERYWTRGEGAAKIRWGTPGDFNRCVSNLREHFPADPEGLCANLHHEALGVWPGREHGKSGAHVLTAGMEVRPHAAMFVDPQLGKPTPLVVTDDGRVYGHLATWKQCHMGVGNKCVIAPHTKANYKWFKTGSVLTHEGSTLRIGKITIGTGHADKRFGIIPATEHYDDTGTCIAVVNAGEDRFGVWVAGALVAGVTEDRVAELRRSPLSGDWRRVDGNLELVAALAVNNPGFPVLDEDGDGAYSLVAAGIVGEFGGQDGVGIPDTMPEVNPGFADVDRFLADHNQMERVSILRDAFQDLPPADCGCN